MKTKLASLILFLFASLTYADAPDGLVSFYVGGGNSIHVVRQYGILEIDSRLDAGAFQFSLNDESGLTDYEVTVMDDGNPTTQQIKNREGGAFKLIIWRLTAGEPTFTAIPYDPDVLCTVSVNRVPE